MGEKFVNVAGCKGYYLLILFSVYKQGEQQTISQSEIFLKHSECDLTLSVLQLGFSIRLLVVESQIQSQPYHFVFSGGQSDIWTGFFHITYFPIPAGVTPPILHTHSLITDLI
jgi:hypothetical protein